jgi:hypothetical protein
MLRPSHPWVSRCLPPSHVQYYGLSLAQEWRNVVFVKPLWRHQTSVQIAQFLRNPAHLFVQRAHFCVQFLSAFLDIVHVFPYA